MYVPSPSLSKNGTIQTLKRLGLRSGPDFQTYLDAKKDVAVDTHVHTYRDGYTERSQMRSGIIGYKNYINTPYRCVHVSIDSTGSVTNLCQYGTSQFWKSERFPLYSGGSAPLYCSVPAIGYQVSLPTPGLAVNALALTNLRNRGLMECKQKCLQSKMDLAESLVDLDKSVIMVARTASSVLKAWRAVRAGRPLDAVKHLGVNPHQSYAKSAAELWLQLQYGWMPLLNDIFNGVNEVNRLLTKPESPAHFTATRRVGTGLATYKDPGIWNPLANGQAITSMRAEAQVEVKYRVRVRDSNLFYLSSLGLTNPLYIAWVAVPFSFVVDWLLPVGDWLNGMSAPLGLDFVDGYITTKTFVSNEVSVSGLTGKSVSNGGQHNIRESFGTAKLTYNCMYMSREPLFSFPGVLPYIRFPFSSNQRIASTLALLETSRKHR